MKLHLDIEGHDERPALPGDGADLVALMSFAAMRGFGAQHPLISLAEHLQIDHHVRLGPLTTFYEGHPEDAEDEEKLNLAWQDAASLLEAAETARQALETDARCHEILGHTRTPGLAQQLQALADAIRHAAQAGQHVRMSYEL